MAELAAFLPRRAGLKEEAAVRDVGSSRLGGLVAAGTAASGSGEDQRCCGERHGQESHLHRF
jgi:hypothetical protein